MMKFKSLHLRFRYIVLVFGFLGWFMPLHGQDNCGTASVIAIPNGGYDLGIYTGSTQDLTGATLQALEYTHPNQFAADKSVWYRFSIPTARQMRILLAQPVGGLLSPNQVGWTLYRASACLPGAGQVVEPSIVNIEGYTHDCLKPGDYYIQVTAQLAANGPIYMELESRLPVATETQHDHAGVPYNFGTPNSINLPPALNRIYSVGCQTIFNGEGTCPAPEYTQSTWHVFNTDAQVDFLRFEVLQNSPWDAIDRNWGYRLYRGDARVDSVADCVPVGVQNLIAITSCRTLTQPNVFNVSATPQNQPGPPGSIIYPCDRSPTLPIVYSSIRPLTTTALSMCGSMS